MVLRRSFTLTGGYSGKQFVPQTREFEFTRGGGETAAGSVELKECVKISHKEAWLCEIAMGIPMYLRPLARVRIVRELTQLVAGDAAEVDTKMAALAFDSEESDDAETPKKGPGPARKRKQKKTTAVAGLAISKVVEVQEQPSPQSRKIPVYAALDSLRRLLFGYRCAAVVDPVRQGGEGERWARASGGRAAGAACLSHLLELSRQ